ncbi:MAG TPA: hypothetical protein VMR97_07685 [Acidimicrobiales bacterium]|nr:hypothetical protein [Acidimicrobiales bacterium]
MGKEDAVGTGARKAGPPSTGRPRRSRRLPPLPRGAHRCMVLACGPEDVAAVDMTSGALVRLRVQPHDAQDLSLASFDVVDARWAADPERDDLAQPEAVSLEGAPVAVGAMKGRRARRVLRHLVAPAEQNLLGFPGSSAPYWEFGGMRPSVALVVPSRGPLLFRRRSDERVWARFGWPRSDNWLPVEDRRAVAALWASRRDRLAGRELSRALGFRPHFLVVTLSRPRDGHCYKTVAAILPRP